MIPDPELELKYDSRPVCTLDSGTGLFAWESLVPATGVGYKGGLGKYVLWETLIDFVLLGAVFSHQRHLLRMKCPFWSVSNLDSDSRKYWSHITLSLLMVRVSLTSSRRQA